MYTFVSQLNKLRGRTFHELLVRSRQELSKFNDKLFRSQGVEISDRALVREFESNARNGSSVGTAELLLSRLRSSEAHLLPVFSQRDKVVEMMNQRFATQGEEIIIRAEKAVRGRFDLLGHKDLSFGDPINWHLDPISGNRPPREHWSKFQIDRPLGNDDPKVIWELNRHTHFVTLGQAYWLTSDERFVSAFIEQATAWMDANPPGIGINWMSSLEAAFRAIAWLWALQLCSGSTQLTADFTARMIKSLIAHGRHIESYLSYYFSPNTHLTGEALGLLYLGLALPELRRAGIWRETGLRILLDQLPKQVRNDGVYFEQASYYHRYTTDFYSHLLLLGRVNGLALPGVVEKKLAALLDHLMWITRPDGTSPLFGDDDGGRLLALCPRAGNDFRDTLGTGAALLQRGDWKYVARDAPVEALWLLGPEEINLFDRLSPQPPQTHARAFGDSGYFVLRDGWTDDASFALIDCGPHGAECSAAHAHADMLSLEFVAQGVTWLVDPGTFVYGADPRTRDEFRSTSGHNTVTVDGEPQSVPAPPFSWRTIANGHAGDLVDSGASICFTGRHDGYHRLADPVTHTRNVVFTKTDVGRNLPAKLTVRDIFSAQTHHRYVARYHFTPECAVTAGDNRIVARHANGSALVINRSGTREVKASVTGGWVSTCYGGRTPAPVLVFEIEGEGPQQLVTEIFIN
jgi:hypothetical protein